MSEDREFEARSIDEAILMACEHFDTTKEKLTVEVISKSPRMLNFLGIKKVRIKVNIKDTNKGKLALESLTKILSLMNMEAKVEMVEENKNQIKLMIMGDGSGILIGRKGQTLDALQYLIQKIINNKTNNKKQVIIDTEGYREKKIKNLAKMAQKLGEKAKKYHTTFSTEPLNSRDRKIIHLTLHDDEKLITKSEGNGLYKKIVISPQYLN
ncbi:MAG: RNA-binding cell elongation regulator Jag/EloR [Thermodesulfobacteriota bacterium]|nr:RNA-binding cell elongation regulator Jag/EloR [Thermodesulfobacteriota bacterium]